MKCCTKCKNNKSLEAFHKKTAAKDGRSSWCKECSNKRAVEYYQENPEVHKEQNKLYYSKIRENNQKLIYDLTDFKCVHCGFTHKSTAPFDWHHLGGKDVNVSQLMQRADTTKLLEEISKCIFLCSNCHRIEHERLREENNGA